MEQRRRWRIRLARAADRAFLEQLALRLTIGIPPWRSHEAMLATARRWLLENLDGMGTDTTMFIAEDANGTPVGAATVGRSTHFTGTPQGELGELAVVEAVEGQGAAALLLEAAEAWAREQRLPLLSLGTGIANARARAFTPATDTVKKMCGWRRYFKLSSLRTGDLTNRACGCWERQMRSAPAGY